MLDKSAWATFVFFGFLSFFFVVFYVPETKGILLETMDVIFKDRAGDEDAKMRAAIESEVRSSADSTRRTFGRNILRMKVPSR